MSAARRHQPVTVTIVGPLRNGLFDVHATGCADLARPKYRGYRDEAWTSEVSSKQEIVEEIYSDLLTDDRDWTSFAQDVHVLPCAWAEHLTVDASMTRSDDEREYARLIAMSDVEFLAELRRASGGASPLLRAASFHLSMAMSDSEDDDEEEA